MQPRIKSGEFSYAHFRRWPEDERRELIDGLAVAMAPPSVAHQRVVTELTVQLGSALRGHRCVVLASPVGVRLPIADEADDDIQTVLQPDLPVVCDPAKIDRDGIRGAPDLVIEVLSPSTAAYDLIEKRQAYERGGVRELWLIDIAAALITRYQQVAPARFGDAVHLRAEGRIALNSVPELALDLDFIAELRAP